MLETVNNDPATQSARTGTCGVICPAEKGSLLIVINKKKYADVANERHNCSKPFQILY